MFRPGLVSEQHHHVDFHGQLTLKQLRLSVLNEMHTNSYTGPRLNELITVRLNNAKFKAKFLFNSIENFAASVLEKYFPSVSETSFCFQPRVVSKTFKVVVIISLSVCK